MESGYRLNKLLKPAVFIASLLPLSWLVFKGFTSGLGANPIEKTLHHMGDWALNFLMITLALSPLKKLTGFAWPMHIRRMIGLFAFFYATFHVLTYLVADQFFDWDAIIEDIIKHKRIIVGLAGYILMIPLAITSTGKMVQRLGIKRWQALHRMIYLSAICGVIHYLWLVKLDMRTPFIYAAVLSLLLGYRVVLKMIKKEG